MGPTIKLGFAQKVALRYKKAKGDKKSQILDEFCATFDYQRKYAIRKLNALLKRKCPHKPKQKPGPKSKYNLPEVLKPLKAIWLAVVPDRSKVGFTTAESVCTAI